MDGEKKQCHFLDGRRRFYCLNKEIVLMESRKNLLLDPGRSADM